MTETEQKSILKDFDDKYLTVIFNSKDVLKILQRYLFSIICTLKEHLEAQRINAALGIISTIDDINNALEGELDNLSRQCSNILNHIYEE